MLGSKQSELVGLAIGLGLSACAPRLAHPSKAQAPPAAPAPARTPARESAPAPQDAAPKPADPPRTVTYLGDGTLLVEGARGLLAWTPQSGKREIPLPEGQRTLIASPAHAGVAVVSPDGVALLTTPDLTLAYEGGGTALTEAPVIHLERERVVLVQTGSKLARLDTRSAPEGASVETLTPLLGGRRFSVTFIQTAPDGSELPSALLYDAQRQVVLGSGLPFRLYPVAAPRASHAGKVGFSIEKREVLRWDLEKGTVERRAAVRCAGDREVGNPTSSPSADLLVVTCGADLIVLDGSTLKTRRRIARVVPGCDQGPSLNGRVLSDGKTLLLEGCGGIAKLDLGSGTYACGDSEGVMGAPYLDGPPAPGSALGLPRGRKPVPACHEHADEQANPIGRSASYQIIWGERTRIIHAGAALELEPDSQPPVLSPDEAWLAYARSDHVVVRALPGGEVRALLRLDSR